MELRVTFYYTLSISEKGTRGAHSLILQYMQFTIYAMWKERDSEPRKVIDAPSLEPFKINLGRALSNCSNPNYSIIKSIIL